MVREIAQEFAASEVDRLCQKQNKDTWVKYDHKDISTHPSHKDYLIFVVENQDHIDQGPWIAGDYLYNEIEAHDEKLKFDQSEIVAYLVPSEPPKKAKP